MAKANETKPPETALPATPVLIEISCPSGPRRRAGHMFGPSPTVLDAGDLTDEQREAILADTMLVVRPAKPADESRAKEPEA